MNRRDFFKALPFGLASLVRGEAGGDSPKAEPKVGHTLASDDARKYVVYLDGVDVSRYCWEADDERGFVTLYMRDRDGHVSFPPRSEVVYGDVIIRRR